MAARNRARPGHSKDGADEELDIWQQIRSDAKRGDAMAAEQDSIMAHLKVLEAQLNAYAAKGTDPPMELVDEALNSSREGVKIAEEIKELVAGDPNDNSASIMGRLDILQGLRAASEADINSRNNAPTKPSRHLKRKDPPATINDDRDSVATDSPGGPSPKVIVPNAASRQIGKSMSRSGSVPAGREASVKPDDGTDSADGMRILSERLRLTVGTEVLYRRNKSKPNQEGEGILCEVTNVIGDGKQRRYEIRDSDPDPPAPQDPYRASVSHLVPIPPPEANDTLPELPPGKQVLALYPGTTTFYKAEVVPLKNAGSTPPAGYVRLRFEGEDEADREMEVERRYVLHDSAK